MRHVLTNEFLALLTVQTTLLTALFTHLIHRDTKDNA